MPSLGFFIRTVSSTITIIGRRWPERQSPIKYSRRHSSKTTSTNIHLQLPQQSRRETMPNPNKTVDTMQQLVNSDSTGGWEKCWEEGATPWDLGQPTPVLLHLLRSGDLPKGRALIPGCGRGYDVVAIACPERYVVGLDISGTAIRKAKEVFSSSPNSDYLNFLTEDFFTWRPDELFDLIFDYTFFCALEPKMRSAWASRIHDLLKADGELITLMFPVSDHVGGPPYKVSVADYKEVLNPIGFKDICIMDNEMAVGPRKSFVSEHKWSGKWQPDVFFHSLALGKEKLGRWKRSTGQSLL